MGIGVDGGDAPRAAPTIAQLRTAGLLAHEVFEWQPSEIVWRVHRTTGSHVLAWDALREFGPILRFDHHPLPRGEPTPATESGTALRVLEALWPKPFNRHESSIASAATPT